MFCNRKTEKGAAEEGERQEGDSDSGWSEVVCNSVFPVYETDSAGAIDHEKLGN